MSAAAAGAQPAYARTTGGVLELAGDVVLDEALELGEGVLVRVLPGATIRASPGADAPLVVRGRLVVDGTPDALVLFEVPVVVSSRGPGPVLRHAVFQADPAVDCGLALAVENALLRNVTFEGGVAGLCVRPAPAASEPFALSIAVTRAADTEAPLAALVSEPWRAPLLWPESALWAPFSPDATLEPAPQGLVFEGLHVSHARVGVLLGQDAAPVRISNSSITNNTVGLRSDGGRALLDHVTFDANREWDIQSTRVGDVRWTGSHVEVSCVSTGDGSSRGCERGSLGLSPILALLAIVYLLSEAGRYVLARGAFVRIYSRLDKGELLDHPIRARLLDLVRARPGIHVRALVDEIGGYGRTVYHLHRLEESCLLRSQRDGLYRRFYLPSQTPEPTGAPDTRDLVLKVIQQRPGVHARGIAKALGLSRQLVAYHVARLAEAGMVRAEVRERRVLLTMAPIGGEPHPDDG